MDDPNARALQILPQKISMRTNADHAGPRSIHPVYELLQSSEITVRKQQQIVLTV